MEKGPEIRIVGRASEKAKKQARQEIEQAFFRHFESLSPQAQEQLKKLEYPKSEKEIALINFANKETSRLMQEAGIEPYDVPVENYHIIPPELWREVRGGNDATAMASYTSQGILFNAEHIRDNPVYFGAVVLHETLHLKEHFSAEVEEEGGEVKKTPYREGVTVRALQRHRFHGKYHEHFAGLHEAIVAETQKRLLGKLLNQPELAEEREWLMSDEAKELRKKIAQRQEIPEDDIIWVGKRGEDGWVAVSYREQREVLNYVCAEIQRQFPDQYQSVDDVFKEFLKAHFTGQLLSIGSLVEKTFGEGSFRVLGNMSLERGSGVLHLETLKKASARQMKKAAPHNFDFTTND